MKKALFVVAVAIFLLVGAQAWGQLGNVVCQITIPADGGTASTADTCTCPADGGACTLTTVSCGCNWRPGTNIDMQCTTDVYVNKDGGAAAASDWKITFTSPQTDPVTIYLQNKEQHVSVKNVTAASGTTCSFGPSWRVKPK